MTALDPRVGEIEAVPAEAVEAAARVHFERDGGRWDDWTAEDKAVELEDMRAALAAAHPVLLAELRKAHEALADLLYVAEHKAADNQIGRWWAEVIRGPIVQHLGEDGAAQLRAAVAAAKGDERG